MWPNPAETNIMISLHADAVIADAYTKGFRGFDSKLAYEALMKDATIPPVDDTILAYGDRDKMDELRSQGRPYQLQKSWLCAFRQNSRICFTNDRIFSG